MACWVTLDELRPLLDNIGGDGVHLEMDFHNEAEVEEAMKIVEEYRGKAPSAKKDEADVIKLTVDDADAEVERIISKIEDEAKAPINPIISDSHLPEATQTTRVEVAAGVPAINISIPPGTTELHLHVYIHNESAPAPATTIPTTTKADAKEASKGVFDAIVAGKADDAAAATRKAVDAGMAPQDIINDSMIAAMGEVGQRFQDGKAFVPQLLMAGRAMKAALELLKPMMAGVASTSKGKVVIGTVKGDLHDIGKNLVASMLEGCGFEVINIGIDVPADKFVDEVRNSHPDILCMSALLTTTMTYMKDVIQALEDAGLRDKVKIMVGGAPVSQRFADEIGADAYSDNANTAVAVATSLMQG